MTTRSEDQTIALGEALGRALAPGDVVGLHGELGAGKTRLVRGIARGAGADPSRVSSPTFVIMQEYPCAGAGPIRTLVHVDAYRLGGADELETIGWDRIAHDLEARGPVAAVIEWAERIDAALPRGAARLDIRLEHGGGEGAGETARRVTIEGDEAWRLRPAWAGLESLGGSRKPTRCPITGKPVPSDSPTYPFFDERARLADLGRWMSGSYQVSRELLPDDEADPDMGGA